MQIITEVIEYFHGNEKLIGFLAYPKDAKKLPGVMIVHDWAGLNEMYKKRAIEIAEKGFVAFSVDMYGLGRFGTTNEEKQALMTPIISNRALLRERMGLSLEQFKKTPVLNQHKIAGIGFCFGGLCVLDLARMGADVQGVVSFHGILKNEPSCPTKTIKTPILVLHGYDDPMVSPHDVIGFCEEMKSHHANFQVNMYANTMHAFTNPMANDPVLGTVFQPDTARKTFQAMYEFFEEVL